MAMGNFAVEMVNVLLNPWCVIAILTVVMEVTKPGLIVQVSLYLSNMFCTSCTSTNELASMWTTRVWDFSGSSYSHHVHLW